jgi:hypothetical protein
MSCDEIGELLGVYALDAVEGDEEASVREHLRGCRRCADEVAAYREAAWRLANSGGEAPVALWDKISSEIHDDAAAPEPSVLSQLGERRLRLDAPRRARVRVRTQAVVAALVAVAAAVIVLLAVHVQGLDGQVNRLQTAYGSSAAAEGASVAAANPLTEHAELSSTADGRRLGEVLVLPSGSAYLTGARLPALPDSRTYQLWTKSDRGYVSVALLGHAPSSVAFTLAPSFTHSLLLVTVEPATGTAAPTAAPVASAVV